jgi:hypothetical protein
MIVRYGNRDMNNDTIEEAKKVFGDVLTKYVWDNIPDDSNDKDKISKRIDGAVEDIKKWNNLLDLKAIIEPIREDTQERLQEANDGKQIDSSGDIGFQQEETELYLQCDGIRCLKYHFEETYDYIGEPNLSGKIAMGRYIWTNGSREEGIFKGTKLHGTGRIMYISGNMYEGTLSGGEFHGDGKYTWADGSVFEGTYKKHKRNGLGKYICAKRKSISYGHYTGTNLAGNDCIRIQLGDADKVQIWYGQFKDNNPASSSKEIKATIQELTKAITAKCKDTATLGHEHELTVKDENNVDQVIKLPGEFTVEQLKRDKAYLTEQLAKRTKSS